MLVANSSGELISAATGSAVTDTAVSAAPATNVQFRAAPALST